MFWLRVCFICWCVAPDKRGRVGVWELESQEAPHKIAEALGMFANPHTGAPEMLTSEFDPRSGREQEALVALLFSLVTTPGEGMLRAYCSVCTPLCECFL